MSPPATDGASRIRCRKCPHLILPATAVRCRGYCAICVKSTGWKHWAFQVAIYVCFTLFLFGASQLPDRWSPILNHVTMVLSGLGFIVVAIHAFRSRRRYHPRR